MFSESLEIKLNLQIGKDNIEIPGGNIKKCELNLHTFGFEGKVGFGLFSDSSEDKLFTPFITHDLIKVKMSVSRVYNNREKKPEPIKITAYATKKSVREYTYKEVNNVPVLERYYEISFQDIPAVLWKQHFPVKLYTDKKMPDVLKDQAVADFKLKVEGGEQEETHDMIFLGLEKKLNDASFYDFFMWYIHTNDKALAYDYSDTVLKVLNRKPASKPKGVFLPAEVKTVQTYFSESLRYNTRILNAHSEEHQKIEISQKQAVKGITQDIVMCTAIKKELNDRKKLETSKLKNTLEKIEMTMKEFPSKNCTVGTMVNFQKEYWSKNNLLSDKIFRVFEIQISAAAKEQNLSHNYNAEKASYNMDMKIKMELGDNPEVHLPPYKNPHYPVQVEGKIVSETGKDKDKTYQIYNDKETSQDSYTIHVPLWDKKINAPFIPGINTGHFYFPAFKHSRVVLDLYFNRAEIKNFLDWGEGSRLPMDTQGNHILFGNNKLSETSMKHLYSKGKPVFTIKRTSDMDTEIISMEEDSIILQTKDEE